MYDPIALFCVGVLAASFAITVAVHALIWRHVEPSSISASIMWAVIQAILTGVAILFFVNKHLGNFDALSAEYVPPLATAFVVLFGIFSIYQVLKDPAPQTA
jgi:hypothetical protein